MTLRARVGRHANTGAHCQNWKDDQQAVTELLNKISITNGGAEGTLKAPISPGLASQELYTAILYFQKKQFPGLPTGFVDPGGAMLTKMETLAARPVAPAAPAKPGQWDNLQSGSVDKALRKALDGDLSISHPEVVEIIRSTLSNGLVSASELDDLSLIAATSRSLEPRSKAILEKFVSDVKTMDGGKGPYRLPTDKHVFAANMTCDFLKRKGRSYFSRLERDEIGLGMLMRLAYPGLLKQGDASVCGPAALLFSVLSDNPVQYARYAIDLYEKGKGNIGRILVEPSKDVRSHLPPSTALIHAVDWMTMASLRDSENYFMGFDSLETEIGNLKIPGESSKTQLAGITLPGELAHWFRLSGYSDVREETNLVSNKGTRTVDGANALFAKGYRMVLLIGAQMLESKEQTDGSRVANHWVVQRSLINTSGGSVSAKVFTWGQGEYNIPQGAELSVADFLKNFYGYVAAKP
jgi:hypothetical protein